MTDTNTKAPTLGTITNPIEASHPGNYLGKCITCERIMAGAKRALHCKACFVVAPPTKAQGAGEAVTPYRIAISDLQRANAAADLTVPEDGNYPGGIRRDWLWLTARDCALAALSQPPEASDVAFSQSPPEKAQNGPVAIEEVSEGEAVAMVRVTHKGYGMSLAKHIAYDLPGGDHWLYAHPPKPEASALRITGEMLKAVLLAERGDAFMRDIDTADCFLIDGIVDLDAVAAALTKECGEG